ncbi:hypothetical protein LZU09_07620 [Staphylococcus epidermidis]|nr:hypothetical protein [Staphylococcus epidermidis]MCO6333906.1 hypothetical protein [Staphylococcus epidermidis]MCO6337918.1 hypothetical protein [Staphylococcus epidermidis]
MFHLIDSNRDYLAEFLPFVTQTTEITHREVFIHSALQQFERGDGFPYPH